MVIPNQIVSPNKINILSDYPNINNNIRNHHRRRHRNNLNININNNIYINNNNNLNNTINNNDLLNNNDNNKLFLKIKKFFSNSQCTPKIVIYEFVPYQ
ncbi:hypothetical protein DICPUDRAFT_150070 [Dictyostelium purpureum]|uniref:Uncharacterized protein n=1 Tax=Dictyostelium purpureum TaxID=5786 RepID=F0ZFD5_DICPU|nr:uncharacterized protein DICPUDRAFT_150070 [Dictyostelium purpureum]XP_003290222.1 uncharacterized protein DICPUDRAFT_154714 [Dictyostelium purpureum]EGC33229.1 hypothetical protein DICPUDRAFT_154714 [Dictyostelium purpureum]EGC37336.1 hypothetical protein DICPUDRAFT_150070 [Dictyostelium purpureum]|eukprot:XP_003286150.1 hypothetical protein DICPUDRAFT_150070 [Dictyostelium purpureum]